ncbi:hypothetical protein [Algoriphagus resistens]|uniref:hypothetical protein n=1 Tax=Algoriphagus resistens TaxID=1750590 RepID=UPI00071694C1|nr:hypothetical protein [Algoriphagus resistens]
MNEFELMTKLLSLEQAHHTLSLHIDVWKGEKEVEDLDLKLIEVEEEMKIIEKELIEIESKTYSKKAKQGMINQLNAYISGITKGKPHLKLSRNQGLIIENYLFSIILNDLKYQVSSDSAVLRIPANLHFTYSVSNSVEISDLTDFLLREIEIIKNIQDPNYIKLREFCDGFMDRLLIRFIG